MMKIGDLIRDVDYIAVKGSSYLYEIAITTTEYRLATNCLWRDLTVTSYNYIKPITNFNFIIYTDVFREPNR